MRKPSSSRTKDFFFLVTPSDVTTEEADFSSTSFFSSIFSVDVVVVDGDVVVSSLGYILSLLAKKKLK